MAVTNYGANNQQTRDELSSEPSIHGIPKIKVDNIKIEQGPIQVNSSTIGHSWIVGSSTNGIVGINTNTQDGQQQVVGGAGRVNTVLKVLNNNNIFIERFNFDHFKDTANTTADWNTSTGTCEFDTGEVLQTLEIYKDTGSISRVRIILENA